MRKIADILNETIFVSNLFISWCNSEIFLRNILDNLIAIFVPPNALAFC